MTASSVNKLIISTYARYAKKKKEDERKLKKEKALANTYAIALRELSSLSQAIGTYRPRGHPRHAPSVLILSLLLISFR